MFNQWTPILVGRANPQPGEKALDLACGTGVVTQAIARMVGSTGKVVGLGRNPAMLELAQSKRSLGNFQVYWAEGDAENLPFPDRSFDLITCQQGMQFFGDRLLASKEMKRVLRSTGRVVIAVWQPLEQHPFHFEIYSKIASIMNVPLSSVSHAYSLGGADEPAKLFHQAGFDQVKIEPVTQQLIFPDPKDYIQKAFFSISAVVPTVVQLSEKLQKGFLKKVKKETAQILAQYTQNGSLRFTMSVNIVIATY